MSTDWMDVDDSDLQAIELGSGSAAALFDELELLADDGDDFARLDAED